MPYAPGISIAAMTESDSQPPSDPQPDAPPGDSPPTDGAGTGDASGSTLRIAALLTVLTIVIAAALIVTLGGDEPKPQSIVPITPNPKALAAAGFVEESDGRFAPEGFGMTFDYPATLFELLSPDGETSRDDDTVGISERRRHFLFIDDAAGSAEASPAFRLIRVTYEDDFSPEQFQDFRDEFAEQQGKEPTEVEEVGGVPSFSRQIEIQGGEAQGGTGESTYFLSDGKLYQLISFADRADRRAVEAAREQIIAGVDFSE